jgi:hypothetical protein
MASPQIARKRVTPISAKRRITARHLRRGERLPDKLNNLAGLNTEFIVIDPEWCWVAEFQGRIVAVLLGAPVHGMLFLMRIVAMPNCPSSTLVVLLRQVFRDAVEQGCVTFCTFLDAAREEENRLLKLALRCGAKTEATGGIWAFSTLANVLKY